MTLFLVRYGETGLKGPPVRRRFERMLVENIVRAHSIAGVSALVERSSGRLFVSSENADKSSEILSRTFGVVSFSRVVVCSSDPEEISSLAVGTVRERLGPGSSFAVRSRRTGSHGYTSMELAALVGERILAALGRDNVKVSLNSPDREIFIEVRGNRAYLFDELLPGPGGLPLRSQGRVVSLIEDRGSLLASWLMMRRGCSVTLVNRSDLKEELELLRPWNPWWTGVLDDADLPTTVRNKRASGLVLGWTLEEFERRERPRGEVPVYYPLIGMTKEEIDDWRGRAGL